MMTYFTPSFVLLFRATPKEYPISKTPNLLDISKNRALPASTAEDRYFNKFCVVDASNAMLESVGTGTSEDTS